MRSGFLSFGRLSTSDEASSSSTDAATLSNLPDHDEDTQDLASNRRKLPKRVRALRQGAALRGDIGGVAPSFFSRRSALLTSQHPPTRTAAASIRAYRSSADCRTQRPGRGGGRWKATTATERPAKRRKQARLSIKALPQSAPRIMANQLRRSLVCALRAENTMGGSHTVSDTPLGGPLSSVPDCTAAMLPRRCSASQLLVPL
jgi:hypothetical protein